MNRSPRESLTRKIMNKNWTAEVNVPLREREYSIIYKNQTKVRTYIVHVYYYIM